MQRRRLPVSATHTQPARRELAHRSSNGVDVFLLWSAGDDSLAVVVIDEAADSFELVVTADEALDVFEHPYAYAAFRGLVLDGYILDVAA
jgi:hypothetical protein